MSFQQDREGEIEIHRRRLEILKIQRAAHGMYADPKFEIEIEYIEKEIEKLQTNLRQIEQNEIVPSVTVRVFFTLCEFCSDVLKELLLRQNQKQRIFEIGIANSWKYWHGRHNAEIVLKSLQTSSRLEFCENFQEYMVQYNQESDQPNFSGVNIAVTELPFPQNYYTWNTRNRKGVVVGISSLENLFHTESLTINKIIVRVIQRMLIYSLDIEGLRVHEDTRGCLFDFTQELKDIQYSVDNVRICKECSDRILQDKGSQFLNEINEWIQNSFNFKIFEVPKMY